MNTVATAFAIVALGVAPQSDDRHSINDDSWTAAEVKVLLGLSRMLAEDNPVLGDHISFRTDQGAAVRHRLDVLNAEEAELLSQQMNDRRLAKQMRVDGLVEEAEAIEQEADEKVLAMRKRHLQRIFSVVLEPAQRVRLQQIAKQQQFLMDVQLGNRLAILHMIVEESDLSEDRKAELLQEIDQANAMIQDELREARKEGLENVLDSLPIEKRMLLKEVYGDLYDYKSELEKADHSRDR